MVYIPFKIIFKELVIKSLRCIGNSPPNFTKVGEGCTHWSAITLNFYRNCWRLKDSSTV